MAPAASDVVTLPWRWTRALAEEVSRAPATLRRARLLIVELARLPEQIEELTAALDRTTTTIDGSLAHLSDTVALGMNDRLEHLDEVVSELNDTVGAVGTMVTGVLGSVPGVRRAVRASQPGAV